MAEKLDLIILFPVYNDWESLYKLLNSIESMEKSQSIKGLSYLVVDDCSSQPPDKGSFEKFKDLEIVELTQNLGHQRAIAIGLSHIANEKECDAVIVMDSDGEDRPEDINRLAESLSGSNGSKIIFAGRKKRQEGLIFRFLYGIYKLFFRVLTGKPISFGNFCIIPKGLLQKLVYRSELWNNFAGGVIRSKLPFDKIPTTKGRRLAGKSKMNIVSLIIHGLGAITVHIDVVAVRLLIVVIGLISIMFAGIFLVVLIKLVTVIALPGWASLITVGLASILAQAFVMLCVLVFIVLNYRNQRLFIPKYDYKNFISDHGKNVQP